MKKLIHTLVIAGALTVLNANAGTLTLSTGPYTGANGGGEFTATLSNGEVFQTFCLEYWEHFTPGNPYTYEITPAANSGDQNLHGTLPGVVGDPISLGTAALYKAFRTATLADYFTANHKNNATELQKAFWFLEDESGWQDIGSNKYLALLTTTFGFATLEAAKANYTGSEIAVLHLTTATGASAQDQLYMRVPDGGITIVLLGLALLGLAGARKLQVARVSS